MNTDAGLQQKLRAPNKAPLFGGRSALDRMTNDGFQGLSVVSQYLWAQVYGT
jgi:hypothetical protein